MGRKPKIKIKILNRTLQLLTALTITEKDSYTLHHYTTLPLPLLSPYRYSRRKKKRRRQKFLKITHSKKFFQHISCKNVLKYSFYENMHFKKFIREIFSEKKLFKMHLIHFKNHLKIFLNIFQKSLLGKVQVKYKIQVKYYNIVQFIL